MTADSSQSPEDQRVTPLINWARWNVKHWIWSSHPLSLQISLKLWLFLRGTLSFFQFLFLVLSFWTSLSGSFYFFLSDCEFNSHTKIKSFFFRLPFLTNVYIFPDQLCICIHFLTNTIIPLFHQLLVFLNNLFHHPLQMPFLVISPSLTLLYSEVPSLNHFWRVFIVLLYLLFFYFFTFTHKLRSCRTPYLVELMYK